MTNVLIESVHISQVSAGDTIEHEGELRTVCSNNIKSSEFMSRTLFGDSYNLGTKRVRKVTFIKVK